MDTTRNRGPGDPNRPVGSTPPGATERRGDGSAFRFEQQRSDEGIGDLVRRLADQGAQLAQQQTALVGAEIREAIDDLKKSVAAFAGAAVVGIAGLGVFLMGVAFLLAEAMELWLATLLVALATLGGALALFVAGRNKLQSDSISVERSRRTLERTPDALGGDTNIRSRP